MKRKMKKLEADLAKVKKPEKVKMTKARLVGGPLDGALLEVPKSIETIAFGPKGCAFWHYDFAGYDGTVSMFAKRRTERIARRFIMWYIGEHKRHPDVMREGGKEKPMRNPDRQAHGRGAAKRRAA